MIEFDRNKMCIYFDRYMEVAYHKYVDLEKFADKSTYVKEN